MSTRAVRVDAAASSIWPWLVQMGLIMERKMLPGIRQRAERRARSG